MRYYVVWSLCKLDIYCWDDHTNMNRCVHDEGKNQSSLHLNDLTHVLMPLSRKEVCENQLKLKKSYEEFTGREKRKNKAQVETKKCYLVQLLRSITVLNKLLNLCLAFFVFAR